MSGIGASMSYRGDIDTRRFFIKLKVHAQAFLETWQPDPTAVIVTGEKSCDLAPIPKLISDSRPAANNANQQKRPKVAGRFLFLRCYA